MPSAETIRVLVVDDSAIWRLMLSEIINHAPDLKVVGAAPDAQAAREMAKALNPDVMTLDVEMPGMDGLTFLGQLMRQQPMPVVMVSAFGAPGTEKALKALELGAVDVIEKPAGASVAALRGMGEDIRERLRAAGGARIRAAASQVSPAAPALCAGPGFHPDCLVAIGASTGGTEAIKEVLTRFPADMPGIVIVQHMPESFTASFARRLDGLCRVRVREAAHNEHILPGTAYLAPGHSHLLVRRSSSGHYVTELSRGEPVNRHRPSVDVLFHSVAETAGARALGVLLTGMGKDGAPGMLAMRRAGAWNIAQDQASCVVYGMPREAVALGAVHETLPLSRIADGVVARLAAERALRPRRAQHN